MNEVWELNAIQASAIAAWLDMKIASRLDCYGGYPDAIELRDGKLIIASVNHDGEPELNIFTREEAMEEVVGWDIHIEDGKLYYSDEELPVPYEGDYVSADKFLCE